MSAEPNAGDVRVARLERTVRQRTILAVIACAAAVLFTLWPPASISVEDGGRSTHIAAGRIELRGSSESAVSLATTRDAANLVVRGPHGTLTVADDADGFRFELTVKHTGRAMVHVRPDGTVRVEARHGGLGVFQYEGSTVGSRWYASASDALVRSTIPLEHEDGDRDPR